MRTLTSFFVYGTLKRGQVRECVWPCVPEEVMQARIRGILYDLRDYPAFVEGEGWILGERWILAPADVASTIDVLDTVEGCPGLFQRVEVEIHAGTGMELGFAYRFRDIRSEPRARRMAPDDHNVYRWPQDNAANRTTKPLG